MRKKNYLYLLLFPAIAGVLAGCASVPQITQDKVMRLYAAERQVPKKTPFVFIHGMMGSILKDEKSGRLVWGEVDKKSLDKLALPIGGARLSDNKDSLRPAGPVIKVTLIPGLVEKKVYEGIRDIAVQAGGYTPGKDAFALSYDWRRDLVEAAGRLDDLIERIKARSGQPNLKVDLVCHSMGGLVARYYIRYGRADVLDSDPLPYPTYAGAKNVNKIIMLGTPNSGALESFRCLHEGIAIPPLGAIPAETIFTMPAVYETMPFQGEPVFLSRNGSALGADLYDPANWEKYGWSVFHPRLLKKIRNRETLVQERRYLALVLKRARKFHEALWKGDPDEERKRVTYVLFGSDSQLTLERAILEPEGQGWRTGFRTRGDAAEDPLYAFGDGSVTRRSFLGIRGGASSASAPAMMRLPSAYEVFFSEKHVDMASSPIFIDNMLHALLDNETNASNIWQRLLEKIKSLHKEKREAS